MSDINKEQQTRVHTYKNIYPENGVVADYIEHACSMTDAPNNFQLMGALMALSAVVGKRTYLCFGNINLYPNLWTILVAPSSVYRKTTTLDIARDAISLSHKPHNFYPHDGSPEAFLKMLGKNPQGILMHSEFGRFIALSNKNYMNGSVELLTELYDCPPILEKVLNGEQAGSQIIRVEEPCISWFTASTLDWFTKHIENADVMGGFLARFIILPAFGKEKEYPLPKQPNIHFKHDLKVVLQKIQDNLSGLQQCMFLTELAEALYAEWFAKNQQDIAEHWDNELITASFTRLGTTALKFALLHSLSHSLGTSRDVLFEDIEFGCNLVEYLKANLLRVLNDGRAMEKTHRNKEKVIRLMKAKPGISKGDLQRSSNMTAAELNGIITHLQDECLIRIETSSKGNKSGQRFFYAPQRIMNVEIFDYSEDDSYNERAPYLYKSLKAQAIEEYHKRDWLEYYSKEFKQSIDSILK